MNNTNKHYLGIHFSVSKGSYLGNIEIKTQHLIILLESKQIKKNIYLTSNNISIKDIIYSNHITYSKTISFEEIEPLTNPIILQTKVHNQTSFSITDAITFLKAKELIEFKKETNCENIEFLEEEIQIRIENIIEMLKLKKYLM